MDSTVHLRVQVVNESPHCRQGRTLHWGKVRSNTRLSFTYMNIHRANKTHVILLRLIVGSYVNTEGSLIQDVLTQVSSSAEQQLFI